MNSTLLLRQVLSLRGENHVELTGLIVQTPQDWVTCTDVMSQRVKHDAAGRPRGLLFTSSRNVGSAAGKEAGGGGPVKL